jgi:hypothetical protein
MKNQKIKYSQLDWKVQVPIVVAWIWTILFTVFFIIGLFST